MPATLKDIARQAECSVAVASSVINGAGGNIRYSDAVAARVRDAATTLGYKRRAGSRKTKSILVQMPSARAASSRHDMEFLHALTDQSERCGFRIETVFESEAERHDPVHERLRQGQYGALVVFANQTSALVDSADAATVPVVRVNPMRIAADNCIAPDDALGTRQMVRLLSSCGVRTILYASRGTTHYSTNMRLDSLTGGCAEHGIALWQVVDDKDLDAALLRKAVDAGVDTVVTYFGQSALKVLLLLQEQGLRVPRDMNVVSLAGRNESDSICPLTCVVIPYAEMGRAAADHAVDLIRAKRTTFPSTILAEHLRIGVSCAVPTAPQGESA